MATCRGAAPAAAVCARRGPSPALSAFSIPAEQSPALHLRSHHARPPDPMARQTAAQLHVQRSRPLRGDQPVPRAGRACRRAGSRLRPMALDLLSRRPAGDRGQSAAQARAPTAACSSSRVDGAPSGQRTRRTTATDRDRVPHGPDHRTAVPGRGAGARGASRPCEGATGRGHHSRIRSPADRPGGRLAGCQFGAAGPASGEYRNRGHGHGRPHDRSPSEAGVGSLLRGAP
jgi:hypothetical protein